MTAQFPGLLQALRLKKVAGLNQIKRIFIVIMIALASPQHNASCARLECGRLKIHPRSGKIKDEKINSCFSVDLATLRSKIKDCWLAKGHDNV